MQASASSRPSLPHAAFVLRHRRQGFPQPRSPPRTVAATGVAKVHSSYSFRLREPAAPRTRILFVTPFAVFPPRHGGARRVAELVRGHKAWGDVALVSDEASLYDARSFADFDGLCDVRLVQRGDAAASAARDIGARTREHCHPSLMAAVHAAVSDFKPQIVVVEHAELAPLVRERARGPRWILDLHDAYAPADFDDAGDARRSGTTLRDTTR